MALNFNTTTQVDPAVSVFYDRVLLERGRPYNVHDMFAQTRRLPTRSGDTIKFRRYANLPVASTPIVEGVTPPGKIVSKTDLQFTIKQYGDFIPYSENVSLLVQDAVLTEFNALLGEQAGDTRDITHRDVYVAGTNVYYAGSYADSSIDTRVEVNTAVTANDFYKAREILIGDKAKFITSEMRPGTGQGTMPIPPSYFGIVPHALQKDLQNMTGWLPAHQYPQMRPYPYEIGALPDANIRFLITQNGKIWPDTGGATGAGTTYRSTSGSAVDVYACLVIAQNALGTIPLDGNSLKSVVKGIDSGGVDNALNLRGSAGWKGWWVPAILNDLWVLRMEFACTL